MHEITLDEHELAILNDVLSKRTKIFRGLLWQFPLLVIIAVVRVFLKIFIETKSIGLVLFFLFIGIIYFLLIYHLYKSRIKPLKQDIAEKTGLIIMVEVINKSYFPYVGECFLFFEHEKLSSKQVDAITFFQYNKGDYYPLRAGLHSGIILDDYKNYDLF